MICRFFCPAKVNLFLSVGPLDLIGYHPIRTVFQAVGLYDELIISNETEQTQIVCNSPEFPLENTLSKTLYYLKELTPIPPLHIELNKNIPVKSGLGGGSSDAAILLLGLQKFLKSPLPEDHLFTIATAVGKDVPFFLVGGCAKGEGYGDKVTPLPDIPKCWMLIVKPPVDTPTPEAYSKLDRIEHSWCPFTESISYYNDFELVAPPECLQIKQALINSGAQAALLCGSGSAVFGQFSTEKAAEEAQKQIIKLGYTETYLVPTLSRKESLQSLWM